MTDKLKDQDSAAPAATEDKPKISLKKPAKNSNVIINPPERVDPQRGFNETFKQALHKHAVVLEKRTELVLTSKAARSYFPQEVIEQVYIRGFKSLPLNTNLTREQYAMNRVNSFIAGGAAMVEDCDLLPIVERVGIKGTGGAGRPHIKREKSPYNNKMIYHVVDSAGHVKHSTSDEYAAKKHLATKYHSYMGEGTLSPMKRFEGTKSLVKTYKDDTPGEKQKINEVSDKTLVSYLTKVHADSQKHKADPTKRSPEKANKSVMGFSRAFNKLEARPQTEEVKLHGPLSSSDYMPGKRIGGANLPSASKKKDTLVSTFTATKEKEANEFAKKHGYVVKKHEYPAGHRNLHSHEFQVHKEEVELDEVSKELANRYMHSAFADRKRTDDKMMDLQNKQNGVDKFFRNHKKISKLLAKSDKRTTGIGRALIRLTKEENLDEAQSASVRMYKALQRAKEAREASERRAQELLRPKQEPKKSVSEAVKPMSGDDYEKTKEMSGTRAANLLKHSFASHAAGDSEKGSRAHKLFLKAKQKHLQDPANAEKSARAQMSGAAADYSNKKPGHRTGD